VKGSFSAKDQVRLPKFGPKGGGVLGTALVTAARAETRLSTSIAKEVEKLEALSQELVEATHASARVTSQEVAMAVLREIRLWTGLRSYLKGWVALEGEEGFEEQSRTARVIEASLFSGRAALRHLRAPLLWREVGDRLKAIDDREFEDEIRELGGGPLLDSILRSHEAAGEALGITKPAAIGPRPTGRPVDQVVRDFREAVRGYAVLVEGHAIGGSEGAKDLAHRLLAPIAKWQPTRTKRQAKRQAPAAPVPNPT
jgi:hypothetical protein